MQEKRDLSFLGLIPQKDEEISYHYADLFIILLSLLVVALCYCM